MLTGILLLVFSAAEAFPRELVDFAPYEKNPIFEGRGSGYWDELIRERGWILREEDTFHLWYTGYDSKSGVMKLGYATSPDGIRWTRYAQNPIYSKNWVEDVMIVKVGATYYMFAEGINDRAQWLTSTDRIHWTRQGLLDVHLAGGDPLPEGAYGTPTAWYEDGTWYLFYERNNDQAVWLATSKDLRTWTNVQDEPVLRPGPNDYDRDMIALDQLIKYKGRYYAYYHGLGPYTDKQNWTTAIAASDDLVHWEKYAGNPILTNDQSSTMVVPDGSRFRLYSMHPVVRVFFEKTGKK